MMLIFSVFAVFVVKASLEGRSRAEARELADFYLRGREASTIGVYGGEYRRLAEYCRDSGAFWLYLTSFVKYWIGYWIYEIYVDLLIAE